MNLGGKNTKYKFKLLVRESSFKRFNLYWLPVLFAIAIAMNRTALIPVIVLTVLLALSVYFAIRIRKELKQNLKSWDAGMPNYVELYLDTESKKIGTNGIEFFTTDLQQVRFKVQKPPKQKGLTAVLLNLYFLNTLIEFDLGNNNIITVPIQDKNEIKLIIDILSELNVETHFDLEIYKWCGVR